MSDEKYIPTPPEIKALEEFILNDGQVSREREHELGDFLIAIHLAGTMRMKITFISEDENTVTDCWFLEKYQDYLVHVNSPEDYKGEHSDEFDNIQIITNTAILYDRQKAVRSTAQMMGYDDESALLKGLIDEGLNAVAQKYYNALSHRAIA